MSDSSYPLFPVVSLLGFVVSFIPLPWHLQAWNAGTCIYMFWAGFASLIQFVDSVVWHGSMENVAPVWCDISTKFIIGAGVGIPAASLCINRRLYHIAAVQQTMSGFREKRRALIVDLAIGLGLPVFVMILHVVVQGHRFNIAEDIGCLPAIFVTPLTFPLLFMWPVLIGLVSFAYAALTLRAFWRRRVQFQELLSASSSMSISRYFRLMLLSCLEMALTLPLGIYSIYINTSGVPISPYKSWADTHYQFWVVLQVPAFVWQGDQANAIAVEMGRWIYPCAAFLFFALFGFAEEARRHYRAAFWGVVRPFGLKPCREGLAFHGKSSSLYCYPTKSPVSPRTVVDFLPAYSSAGSDITLHTSQPFGKSAAKTYEIGDIEKLADVSPPEDAYMLYLQNCLPEDGAQDLDCIIIPHTPEQYAAELEFPLTPSTPSTASTISDFETHDEADIGTAR